MAAVLSRRSAMAGAGVVLAGGLTACGTDAQPARATAPVGALVMIVRHAEKPTGHHGPYGVTPDGDRDDHSLTVRGWTRAGALVELFAPSPDVRVAPLRAGLARPVRVIAADPAHGSKRPAQTVTPLAQRLGRPLDTSWAKGQEASLARALAGYGGVTLVGWEHEKIPAIVHGLQGVSPAPPSSWPGDRFDLVWLLRRTAGGWSFAQVPQLLLAGDGSVTG